MNLFLCFDLPKHFKLCVDLPKLCNGGFLLEQCHLNFKKIILPRFTQKRTPFFKNIFVIYPIITNLELFWIYPDWVNRMKKIETIRGFPLDSPNVKHLF